MRKIHFWLTMLSLLALVFRLAVNQPHENLAQLKRLQQQLIGLYEQYRQNATAVELERFMDSQLITRTRGIIDLIRGWAVNASEEAVNANASMDYLRSVVLYTCIRFADSLYDAYSMFDLNPDALLQASEIFQIRSSYEWVSQPSDLIVRFELMQFHQLDIRAKAVNYPPYVQVYSTNTASIRFFHEIFTSSSFFSINLTNMCTELSPVHRNPESNILREVRMLTQVQVVVLTLNELSTLYSPTRLYNELFYLNVKLDCIMHDTMIHFFNQYTLSTSRHEKNVWKKILAFVVLQRFMQFVLAESARHVHHPAHIRYGHVLEVNMTTALNANYKHLMEAYNQLLISLNDITHNNNARTAFHALISDFPLRVGYVCYDEHYLTLRVGLACQS